jgi:hypothetical protein
MVYSQILLSFLLDDCHFGYIKKFLKKNHCSKASLLDGSQIGQQYIPRPILRGLT